MASKAKTTSTDPSAVPQMSSVREQPKVVAPLWVRRSSVSLTGVGEAEDCLVAVHLGRSKAALERGSRDKPGASPH